MLVFTCILGPNLTAGGVMQVLEQVITIGQAMTFTVPFVILALIALVLTVRLFGSFSDVPSGNIAIKSKKDRNERYSVN
jgi:hypothetical protein